MAGKNRKRGGFDWEAFLANLPYEKRLQIAKDNDLSLETVGIIPAKGKAEPASSDKPKRGRCGGQRVKIGTLIFDSKTEAAVYLALVDRYHAVFCHPKIALSDDSHMEPDFIIVHEVTDTGFLVCEIADAKGTRKRNGVKSAHTERDWKVKAKWLRDKFKFAIRVITGADDI